MSDHDHITIVARNRKARHEYHVDETLEAGLALKGSEVKSIRAGRVNMQEAFCRVARGEMYLYNCHISPFQAGAEYNNHDPLRPRKLLLKKREIKKWRKATEQQGYTIIPLKLYFKGGYAKLEIGLAKGKKRYDKRADIAERETKRRMDRAMRGS